MNGDRWLRLALFVALLALVYCWCDVQVLKDEVHDMQQYVDNGCHGRYQGR